MERRYALPDYTVWVLIMFFVAMTMWFSIFMIFGIMMK